MLAGEAGTGAKSNSFNAKQVDVFAFDNVEVKQEEQKNDFDPFSFGEKD